MAIGTKRIIPRPGVGLGGKVVDSVTVEKTKGVRVIAMVKTVMVAHAITAFLDNSIDDRGNVCSKRKKRTESGAAKNITRRTSQIEIDSLCIS